MQTHTHAPPGASGGSLPPVVDPWAIGIPPGYRDALARLQEVRGIMEQAIADAIDQLDLLDLQAEELEPEVDAEPSLGAPETVTCSDGPATPVRKHRVRLRPSAGGVDRKTCQLASPRIDRSCDQSGWSRDTGSHLDIDLELDTSDDEPSLGALERHPVGFYGGVVVDPRPNQELWAVHGNGTGPIDREDDAGDNPEEENEHGSDDDRGADDSDYEPSLGSIGSGDPGTMSQAGWALGGRKDLEEENEHGGDVCDEPHDFHDGEADGSHDEDMEPNEDIPGGDRTRGKFRPSDFGVIGASDIGAGR